MVTQEDLKLNTSMDTYSIYRAIPPEKELGTDLTACSKPKIETTQRMAREMETVMKETPMPDAMNSSGEGQYLGTMSKFICFAAQKKNAATRI